MIRGQYEIVFKCVCGNVHGTEIDLGFVDHELAKQSAAYVYGDNLPQSRENSLLCRFSVPQNKHTLTSPTWIPSISLSFSPLTSLDSATHSRR